MIHPMFIQERLLPIKKKISYDKPLIHCLTNAISINDCANVVLALGAKPIMAEHPKEVEEITMISKALAINLGNITDSRMEAMRLSAKIAQIQNIPWIIDLVGVGCSTLRKSLATELIDKYEPHVIKGNMSEIKAINSSESHAQGRHVNRHDRLDLTLYLVTDSMQFEEACFLNKIEEACKGGVTLVQLREKERSGKDFYTLAKKAKAITDTYDIPLIINDRVDIALAIDAAGVHLGQNDLPIDIARRILGPNKIIGATAKTVPQALKAMKEEADYLGVGAIYPTTTKVATIITEVSTLNEICKAISCPVVAIGGLNQVKSLLG